MDFDFSDIINVISGFFNSISSFLDDSYKRLAAIAAIITICSFIGRQLFKYIKSIKIPDSERKKALTEKLEGFTDDKILNLIKSRRYIPTMWQQEAPHEYDTVFISPKRKPLLEKIINDIFDKKHILDKKRYMILGGSGMGKSTFSVALLYHYLYKYKLKKSPFPIYILSLEKPDAIDRIKNLALENVKQSILILDALDESNEASKDINKYLEDLDDVTKDFRFVIVTCRTQFFENEESEPHKLKIHISGASKRTLEYEKIYVSPFTEKEAKRFIRRKYGLNLKSYFKALRVSKKCWDVLSRPMILSFVDDLIEQDSINQATRFDLYFIIIMSWFKREREINDIEESKLFLFSKKLAVYIYEKWITSNDMSISPEEYRKFTLNNGYNNSPYSFKVRSLVNRKSNGRIKFAHRSFLEFFLAIQSYQNPGHPLDSKGLTMVELFIDDLSSSILSLDPRYSFQRNDHERFEDLESILKYESIKNVLNRILAFNKELDRFFKRHKLIEDPVVYFQILKKLLKEAVHMICIVSQTYFYKHKRKSKEIILADLYNFASSLINKIQETLENNDLKQLRSIIKSIIDVKFLELLIHRMNFYEQERQFLINNKFFRYPFYTSNPYILESGIKIINSGNEFMLKAYQYITEKDFTPVIILLDWDNYHINDFLSAPNRFYFENHSYIIVDINYYGQHLLFYIDSKTKKYTKIGKILKNLNSTNSLNKSFDAWLND